MTAQQRLQIIRANLQAVSRGGRIDDDTLAVWLRELDDIDGEKLDSRIRQARNEHADRVELGKGWGRITPDDVLRVHRREEQKSPSGKLEPIDNPICSYGCSGGRVAVRCPDGYDICVRCACFAGDWWLSTSKLGRGDNVEKILERPGWTLLRAIKPMQEDHRKWIEARSQQVGPAVAFQEYQTHLKEQKSTESSV